VGRVKPPHRLLTPLMKTIFKYTLTGPSCEILMPKDAEILHVGEQHPHLVIWALVDKKYIEEQVTENRFFYIQATGEDFSDEGLSFVGTVQASNGLVWHIFEDFI